MARQWEIRHVEIHTGTRCSYLDEKLTGRIGLRNSSDCTRDLNFISKLAMIYLLHPRITEVNFSVAETFHAACDQELRRHALLTQVDSLLQLHALEPRAEDAIIFFNHDPGLPYGAGILRVVEGAAKLFPVAASRDLRMPPASVSKNQSFDVRHELDLRGLREANAGTVAAVFVRAVLASLQPTLSQFRMRLFLSHRRADGEDLANWFYQQLKQRAENGFQDL